MLHKIKDLIGRDVSEMKVDIRSRNKDGSLTYGESISGYNPVIVKLKSVETKLQKISHRDAEKSKWLYWYWDGRGCNDDHQCGYSGIASGFDDYYLMEVE
jgi:hypothetical protein